MLPAGSQVLGLKAPSDRWNEAQLQLFTRMYRQMKANPQSFVHPWSSPIPERDWNVICWTSAWFAAHQIGPDTTGLTQPATLLKE
jgi:hypothetical protein